MLKAFSSSIWEILSEKNPSLHFYYTFCDLEMPYDEEKVTLVDSCDLQVVYFIGAETFQNASFYLVKENPPYCILIDENPSKVHFFLSKKESDSIIGHKNVCLMSSPHGESLENLLQAVAEKFPLPSFYFYQASSYQNMKVEDILAKFITVNNSIVSEAFFLPAITQNLVHHLSKIHKTPSLYHLQNAFNGAQVIICGAGPSLVQAIPFLRQAQERALIIAGGSAISILNHHGIFPHFQCVTDPSEKEYKIIKGAYSFEVPNFLEARARYDIDTTYNGKEIIANHSYHPLFQNWIQDLTGIKPSFEEGMTTQGGLSVTTFAIDIALWIGAKSIYFVGVDLAYHEEKKYAEGATLFETQTNTTNGEIRKTSDDLLFMKSHFGHDVYTQSRWKIESDEISEKAMLNPQTHFFTLSKEGLGFAEVPYLSLDEALVRMNTQRDISGMIHQVLSIAPKATNVNLKESFRELAKSLKRIAEYLEEPFSENVFDYFVENEIAFEILLKSALKDVKTLEHLEKGISKKQWMVHTVTHLLIAFGQEGLL